MNAQMSKQVLTRASQQLFWRSPDERFESLDTLWQHCQDLNDRSSDVWRSPAELLPQAEGSALRLMAGTEVLALNDWSFSQVCRMANVSKDTLNKLSADTASRVLAETLPRDGKPMQVLTVDRTIRSIHGTAYTRLSNLDLLGIVREFATDFSPPQKGFNGGTGLYCGEQDMFLFLIDPLGWAEIDGEAFAPGFFLWNSEVGRRSVGVQTFWFQAVCQNHIVWDAVEVIDFSRKHTANVRECLSEIRRIVARLVEKRDQRRDGFAKVMAKAFQTSLGSDADEVAKVLYRNGVPRDIAKKALTIAQEQGRFTVFSLVDALTRLAREYQNAGDRLDLDEKAGGLLALAN